jgi:integrase
VASIYKRSGGLWWAKVQRQGRVHRRPLKTKDEGEARRKLSVYVRELDGASFGRCVGDFTVREAIDRFTDEHIPLLKPKAIMRYETSAGWILQHFGEMRLRDIGSRDLYAFEQWRRLMRHRGKRISAVTIKRDLAFLSSVMSEAETWEWIQHNPVKPYIRGRRQKGVMVEGEGRDRYLSHEEEDSLLAAAPDTIRDAIIFAIDTGLRAEEQWSLTRADFNWARRRVRVDAKVAKSSKSRWVPLLDRSWAIAERLRASNRSDFVFWRYDGERVGHTWAYRELQKAAGLAGIDNLEWHDLRRTCGCRLLQDHDMPMAKVSQWLGHSSVKVTEKHYAFLSIEDLERSIKVA